MEQPEKQIQTQTKNPEPLTDPGIPVPVTIIFTSYHGASQPFSKSAAVISYIRY